MSALEKKVDIILEWIASDMSNNPLIRQKAKEALDEVSSEAGADSDVDEVIYSLCKELGVVPSLRGCDYLITAIKLVLDDPSRMNAIYKRIYHDIASEYGTTPLCVERSIRTVCDRVLDYGGADTVKGIFGNIVSSKTGNVTNSTFIACCVREVRRRIELLK